MFFIVGTCFLALLSVTLFMLWAHERITNKRITPRAKIEEYWDSEERRKHQRFDKDLEVEYSVEKKSHLKPGRTINVSGGGMKLLIDEKLPEGSIMDIKAYIPEKKKVVEVEAEVVWIKDAQDQDSFGKRLFHCGVKFIALKEPAHTHLADILHG
ncbi:MAG: PilZ domain-containing protein [Candidatus Omnitrophota bacterium]|nr:PilZ domain-containing protein [Candidatus Omnitrophota bacterium]